MGFTNFENQSVQSLLTALTIARDAKYRNRTYSFEFKFWSEICIEIVRELETRQIGRAEIMSA